MPATSSTRPRSRHDGGGGNSGSAGSTSSSTMPASAISSGPLIEMPTVEFDAVIGVNLRAPALCIKHAAPIMIAGGRGGRIINIASQAGKSGFAFASAYTASKHGLNRPHPFGSPSNWQPRLTVNAICPNHVTTGLGAWQNDFMSKARGQSLEAYLADMRNRIPLGGRARRKTPRQSPLSRLRRRVICDGRGHQCLGWRGVSLMKPAFTWPNGARLAMSLVINIEEGSEMSVARATRGPNRSDELGVTLKIPIRAMATKAITNTDQGRARSAFSRSLPAKVCGQP